MQLFSDATDFGTKYSSKINSFVQNGPPSRHEVEWIWNLWPFAVNVLPLEFTTFLNITFFPWIFATWPILVLTTLSWDIITLPLSILGFPFLAFGYIISAPLQAVVHLIYCVMFVLSLNPVTFIPWFAITNSCVLVVMVLSFLVIVDPNFFVIEEEMDNEWISNSNWEL